MENLKLPDHIGYYGSGNDNWWKMNFSTLKDVKELIIPEKINYGLDFSTIDEIDNIKMPLEMNGDLVLKHVKNIEYEKLPNTIQGNLILGNITSLELQNEFKGALYIDDVESFNNEIVLPSKVNGTLSLKSLKDIENVKLPNEINGDLNLSGLENAINLNLPQKVNGKIDLTGLKSFEKFNLTNSVGAKIYLKINKDNDELYIPENFETDLVLQIYDASKIKFPRNVNCTIEIVLCEKMQNFELPESISKNLIFRFWSGDSMNFKESEKLKLTRFIGGSLILDGIETLDNIILPDEIGDKLEIPDLLGKSELEKVDLSCVKDMRKIKYKRKELEKWL